MTASSIRKVMLRELATVGRELDAFEDLGDIWKAAPGVANSAGNLALHVAGNLQHFVGATLGGTGYERDREAEFRSRGLSREALAAELSAAAEAVDRTLGGPLDLDGSLPLEIAGHKLTTGDFLTHLACHLAYHAGQINYARRLLTGQSGAVGALDLDPLAAP